MPRVTVAPIALADLPSVLAIEDAGMTDAQLREEIARPWSRVWVAREDGGVAAFIVSWHVADELHVLNVATAASKRRRGLARALMETAIAYSRDKKVRHVLLEVRRSNRGAIALYRSTGFFAMGIRPRYYPDDEDAVEMVLLFDADTGAIVAHADEVRLEP